MPLEPRLILWRTACDLCGRMREIEAPTWAEARTTIFEEGWQFRSYRQSHFLVCPVHAPDEVERAIRYQGGQGD